MRPPRPTFPYTHPYFAPTGPLCGMQDAEMVQNLLRMKSALEEVWESAFQRNETYGHALKEAFEHFINQRANKPAELIAKFLDQLLRSGNKGKSEEDLDANLEKALLLFRYISVTAPPPPFLRMQ
jgi:cullin-4